MPDAPYLRIASRRSPLAVAQAEAVRRALAEAHGMDEEAGRAAFPIQTYLTTGDRQQSGSLAEIGGKGLFVKEIERALLTNEADLAVHSMKDLPAEMPEGLVQVAVPAREDPRDAFVTPDGRRIEDVPDGARIGTSSVRRAAQIKRRRPDLRIVPMRGNVQTRLAKLAGGEADGTFLAEAGLRRLGREDVARVTLVPDFMLPALGQGMLCVQARTGDERARGAAAALNDPTSERAAAVERAFVAALDGSCRTPMAGLATERDGVLTFHAEILTLDGERALRRERRLAVDGRTQDDCLLDALAAGAEAARELAEEAGPLLSQMLAR
jgi:hydroxymethylbilane synthase